MTPEHFFKLLLGCGLVSAEQAERLRKSRTAQACDTAKQLADAAVEAQLLDDWEAGQLLLGRETLVLGKYKILSSLGGGGMGRVYRAQHSLLLREDAVKRISSKLSASEGWLQRFTREAQILARLKHENIVVTHDFDRHGETYFLAMDLVEGTDLARFVDGRGPLPVPMAVDLIRQVALGLAHAHSFQIVHRDIKPNNIMVTAEQRAVILDMGLARVAGRHGDQLSLTFTGHTLGTPHYMAPEQFENAHEADIRSDIYSLGCTLYTLLTASFPFHALDAIRLKQLHQESSPKPVTHFRKDVPPWLLDALDRMLAKRPQDRFQSPDELIRALAKAQAAPPAAPPPGQHESANPARPGALAPTEDHVLSSAQKPVAVATVGYHLGRITIEMVRIPAGPFLAGCTPRQAEAALQGMHLRNRTEMLELLTSNRSEIRETPGFEISRCPITNEQYASFVAATGYASPKPWNSAGLAPHDAQKPVVEVSLRDAEAFCAWANLRMPTADEWEKAARGAAGAIYPWGDDFRPEYCHCDEGGASALCDVNAYAEGDGPFGLRQATGNVWEWVGAESSSVAVRR